MLGDSASSSVVFVPNRSIGGVPKDEKKSEFTGLARLMDTSMSTATR